MKTNSDKVRTWLMSGRCGNFDGPDATACVQGAWGASGGLDMSLTAFADALRLLGFRPDYIRSGVYRLVLPDRPSR